MNIKTEDRQKNNSIDMIKENNKKNMWVDSKLNVIIPMAGLGSRFEDSEHILPKPLVDVNQKPMIQVAVENLNINANYIYVVQKQHRRNIHLDSNDYHTGFKMGKTCPHRLQNGTDNLNLKTFRTALNQFINK